MPNYWPLEGHNCAEVFSVRASFKTGRLTLWSGLLTLSARAAALRENRVHCLYCHKHTHSFRNCRHPFINASGCLNPELGQLGDDDAYRRWQARMTSYRRAGKSSRLHTHNKNRRNHSNQSRGHHQDLDQVNSHCGNHSHGGNHNNPYTPGEHGGVPPSPASSAPATTPGKCVGAIYDLGGNLNAHQPGTFRTGN